MIKSIITSVISALILKYLIPIISINLIILFFVIFILIQFIKFVLNIFIKSKTFRWLLLDKIIKLKLLTQKFQKFSGLKIIIIEDYSVYSEEEIKKLEKYNIIVEVSSKYKFSTFLYEIDYDWYNFIIKKQKNVKVEKSDA